MLTYNNIIKELCLIKGIVLSKSDKNSHHEQNKILYNNYCGESSPKPHDASYEVEKGINKNQINQFSCEQSHYKMKHSPSNQTL